MVFVWEVRFDVGWNDKDCLFFFYNILYISLTPYFYFDFFQQGQQDKFDNNHVILPHCTRKKTPQSFIYLSIIGHISSTACNYYLLQLGSIYGGLSWSAGEQWVCNLKDLQAAHKITVMDEKII